MFPTRRSNFSLFIGLCIIVALAGGCSRRPETDTASAPPEAKLQRRDVNVLLITIDTLRADALSSYGSKTISTPRIDALAARGVRFAQAIAQVPLTAPSHGSILTGTYPQQHKLRDMGGFVLDGKIPTLASTLAAAGFETAAFVGASVLHQSYGLNRGFTTYNDSMKDEKATNKLPGVVAEVRGEVVTRRALEWLDRQPSDGKRFFLWSHYYDPHFPYDPPEPHRSRYGKNKYGGEVAYTDAEVGRLLDGLKERARDHNTLIVLLADHGESLGDHGEYSHGVFLYDATMRIPLIVAGPGIPAEKAVTQQVRSIDVMPTILEYAGIATPAQVQGLSLLPAIVDGKRVRTNYCYMETLYPKTHMGWSELRGMRTDDWKLVVAPKPELYRISEDQTESRNIVERHPVDADHLQKKVWEVAGPPGSLGELKPQPIDEERRRELQSLGYVSAGQRKLRIDMSGPDPKDRAGVLEVLERATEAMNHDRFRAAVPLLEKISRQDPTNPMIYKQLGLCFQRLEQFDKAEQAYQGAIKNKADSDETYSELGEIYVRRGDLGRATDLMERAARLNPTNLENMVNLATAYLHLSRPEETQRVLRAVLTQDERHAPAHNLLGIVEIQRGQQVKARAHFESAVKYDPEFAEPYMNLGLLAQNAGETKAAIGYYRNFLKKAQPDKYGEIIPKVKAALADLGASP